MALDFTETSWLDTLKTVGFDSALPTFVLWEGVSYYLRADVVEATLRAVASLAPHSAVAFDYFADRIPNPQSLRGRLFLRYFRSVGEPLIFGLPTTPPSRAHAEKLVVSCGLRLEQHEPLGEESARAEPFGGLVVATVGTGIQDST